MGVTTDGDDSLLCPTILVQLLLLFHGTVTAASEQVSWTRFLSLQHCTVMPAALIFLKSHCAIAPLLKTSVAPNQLQNKIQILWSGS